MNNAEMLPFENFDESAYLQLNADVRAAVPNGGFSSGWDHYIRYGYKEDRSGVPTNLSMWVQNLFDAGGKEPAPPPHLRKRVHGDEALTGFDTIGRVVSLDIYRVLQSPSVQLPDNSRLLDFGCGCGRILRYFHHLYKRSSLHGTDIDQEAISWCQHHLSQIGSFVTNEKLPSLRFPDEYFDFVYSVSVFTHLPEDMQLAWLKELQRVTKSGSYLLLTVHGEGLFQEASEEAKKRFQEIGFYYAVGTGTEGLPNFYQTSFHTERYIRRYWTEFFEIKTIIQKGIANHQDLILCRRTT